MRSAAKCIGILLILVALAACGGEKQSAVEGKLVDWNGKPVGGVKIIATQVEPLKGYEQLEAVTSSDGSFRIRGLFPSSEVEQDYSKYVLEPWSDKWTFLGSERIDSAPQGETAILRSPMRIFSARSKRDGRLVANLATGEMRFAVSSDGVIKDSSTGLEWVVGPDRDTNYAQAEYWVARCNIAGGGWRMPTRKELAALHARGVGGIEHFDDALGSKFQTRWWRVWAEPRDSSYAWRLTFGEYDEASASHTASASHREDSYSGRVFGVRSRARR